ncbi:tellurite resistance TerB family protein [Marichromatium bheemlicum]|uniref:Tellurite resistance TerB family protein n=1 Tax=Marichromatium bheemlicum TaxID=365339 RepID=A0ABX1I7C8_9GAMM|nr:tellurite resistance TerB family protein [Marichromatium bheemlicum]NKN32130.1 tellurite resistance TerB family protein [Marichromatium bheemlicum]
MAGFGDLLGSLLQNNLSSTGTQRLTQGLGQHSATSAEGGGGGLSALLDGARGVLGQAADNPLQAGGLGAALGSVLGGGGDAVRGALTGGALAMLAGVAYKALANAEGQGAAQPPAPPAALPEPVQADAARDDKARLLVRAMINAAKADGQIGVDEMQRIVDQAAASGLEAQVRQWLADELLRPLDLDAFAAEIPDRETAAEVYAASLLAIEVDTPEERAYLDGLAARTGLGSEVTAQLQGALGVAG